MCGAEHDGDSVRGAEPGARPAETNRKLKRVTSHPPDGLHFMPAGGDL